MDGDGECQPEEPGIGGIKVTLNPENRHGASTHIVFTDPDGWYRFEDVTPGRHRLRFEDPTGQWLAAPVEQEISTVLHQTIQVELLVTNPLIHSYLPFVGKGPLDESP